MAADSPSDEGFTIGQEMADARAADEDHRRRTKDPAASPLEGVRYSADAGEHNLLSYVPSALDATVAAFVDEYVNATDADRSGLRSRLGMDDFYTLIAFGRRACVAALRSGDPSIARRALDAASMIDMERLDWRDLVVLVAIAAHVIRRLGGDPESWIDSVASRAQVDAAAVFTRFARPSPEDADLGSWGLIVMDAGEGDSLVDLWGEPYRPTVDLLRLALHIGAHIDSQDSYRTGRVAVGVRLAPVWLPGAKRKEEKPVLDRALGTISINCSLAAPRGAEDDAQSLLTFLIEARDPADAEELENWARHPATTHAVATAREGPVIAVAIARSTVHGVASRETTASLGRLVGPFSRILAV